MKKLLAALLLGLMIFSLAACSSGTEQQTTIDTDGLIDTWISYNTHGEVISYTFRDDGSISYVNEEDDLKKEYTYRFEGSEMYMEGNPRDFVYVWDSRAVGFLTDRSYDEIMNDLTGVTADIENFNGYIYVDHDLLYFGTMVLCRESALENAEDASLVGEWVGVKGDSFVFTEDACTYIEEGERFEFSYTIKEETGVISIKNDTDSHAFSKDQWYIKGRVLYISERYYFKKTD